MKTFGSLEQLRKMQVASVTECLLRDGECFELFGVLTWVPLSNFTYDDKPQRPCRDSVLPVSSTIWRDCTLVSED